MNQLILFVVEHGWGQLLYNVFFAAGFVAVFLFALINGKRYGIPRWKALTYIFGVYTISVIWMFFQCWVENGFKGWGGNNIVRTFVWVPLAALAMSKLLGIDWKRGCDFVAPCVPLVQAVSHWGCLFTGCCHGYPFKWGIYNPALHEKVFPMPIVEALAALAVVIIICRYEKKRDYQPDGYAYPLMLMMFGYSRFILEFGRDNTKLFWGISNLALHALFMALVGTAVYVTLKENARQHLINTKKQNRRKR